MPLSALQRSLAAGRLRTAVVLAATLAGCAATAPPPAAATLTVKIVAFNDFHGTLQSPGRFGSSARAPERPEVGGADALAAHVARLRARNPNSVVVGGGDFVGASPLASALFFDEPAVEVLNRIGVEFTSVGNHEFDHGADELKRLQHGGCKLTRGRPDPASCKGLGSAAPGTFDGARFQWLAANVIETPTGQPLLPAYGVKSFEGVPVAFIGMTLRGTPGIVSPAGIAGLEFRDEADTVNALVPQLRAQGIGAIVVLVHQGGVQGPPSSADINGCDAALHAADGADSDIGAIVRRLDDAVDLVISAHTHAAYNCSANAIGAARATGLPNKSGRLVPVTSASAFGRVLTDIDLTLDRTTHRVLAVSPTNRLVDRDDPAIVQAIAAAPAVRDIAQGYATLAAPLANRVVGWLATALPATPDEAGEQPAGSLIADTQLRATQAADVGGAQIAFMNAGGVRAPGFAAPAGAAKPFALTYGAVFTVQPFGNSLVTMTLTSTQLKALLEQQFTGCGGQVADRPLQPSSGLRVTWRAGAPPCARIADVIFTPTDLAATPVATGPAQAIVRDGVVLEPGRTWRVTVNNYLANGGDGFSTLTAGTQRIGGAQDIDALVAYMASTLPPNAPYDPREPALGEPRLVRLP